MRSLSVAFCALFAALAVADAQPALLFPQLADGGGITSEFILTNPTLGTVSGTLSFKDDLGRPLSLSIEGVTRASAPFLIESGGAFRVATDGGGRPQAGYAIVEPDEPDAALAGSVIYNLNGFEVSVPPVSSSKQYHVFVERGPGTNSGVAFVNSGVETISIESALLDQHGGIFATRTLNLGPGDHLAQFITELFQGVPEEFEGTLHATSASPFHMVGLRQKISGSLAILAGSPEAIGPGVGLAASLQRRSFVLPDGAALNLPGRSATLAFGSFTGIRAPFVLATEDGFSATGTVTIGSCTFQIESSTFLGVSGLEAGDTIRVDPCTIGEDSTLTLSNEDTAAVSEGFGREPPPTELQDVGVVFTGDPRFGAVAGHRNGEALALLTRSDEAGNIVAVDGVLWRSGSHQAALFAGADGRPSMALFDDVIVLFANFTSDGKFDAAFLAPGVPFEIVRGLELGALGESSSVPAGRFFRLKVALDIGATLVSVTGCALASASVLLSDGITIGGAVLACSSVLAALVQAAAPEEIPALALTTRAGGGLGCLAAQDLVSCTPTLLQVLSDRIALTNLELDQRRDEIALARQALLDPLSVAIDSPVAASVFVLGERIHFQGSAGDAVGTPVADQYLYWVSNRDGEIGRGRSFSSDALSEGLHTVRLEVRVPDRPVASATTFFDVHNPSDTTLTIDHLVGVWNINLFASSAACITFEDEFLDTTIMVDRWTLTITPDNIDSEFLPKNGPLIMSEYQYRILDSSTIQTFSGLIHVYISSPPVQEFDPEGERFRVYLANSGRRLINVDESGVVCVFDR